MSSLTWLKLTSHAKPRLNGHAHGLLSAAQLAADDLSVDRPSPLVPPHVKFHTLEHSGGATIYFPRALRRLTRWEIRF